MFTAPTLPTAAVASSTITSTPSKRGNLKKPPQLTGGAPSQGIHHPKFQPSDSTDVTFRSCDGMLFCLHRKNLETHADSFPGPEISVLPNEVIDLTETSEVLAVVFDLMYPRKQADFEGMTFEVVIRVAEAVEKYQIFSAMKACEFRLKQLIPKHPAEIMSHGMKHDYPALINDALPRLARKPLVEVIERLPPRHRLAWCRYHQTWNKVFRETLQSSVESASTSAGNIHGLKSTISQILEWEALDDVTTLQHTLKQAAARNTGSSWGFGEEPGDSTQQAASICLQKIQAMPPISLF